MRYMPIFVDLSGKRVLLSGAGRVALRRARQLLAAGAELTVIAPHISEEFRTLPDVELVERTIQPTDVSTLYQLVIIATDNAAVNAMISDQCDRVGVLCNRCDDFAAGNFVCGKTLARGPIICSTMAGGVPEVAKFLNTKIESLLTPGFVELAALLAELRPAIKASNRREQSVRDFIGCLVNDETITRIEHEGTEKLREEILACL
ncbi:MAG: bifunctional precorrin-2 dehydrogenase/sirohydrochlorin ferrochelatase [Candidatus Riflebacteria bacterium]|nr:bifunctional precorrin-2 dehydrogenase/sirohydrochlorin ferrochelatase [Candidatus Riflebacteria bacterium]